MTAALAIAVVTIGAGQTHAASGDSPQALKSLQAMVQPILKLTGSGRTLRTCGYAPKIQASANAVPKSLPASAVVDAETWKAKVGTLASAAHDLNKACSSSDMTLKDEFGKVQTVEDVLLLVNECTNGLVEATKTRNLSPAIKSFDTTLRSLWSDKKRKTACKSRAELAKFYDAIGDAPAGVDGTKWSDLTNKIASHLGEMKHHACPTPQGESFNTFNSELEEVHEEFYDLVLLIPAAQ